MSICGDSPYEMIDFYQLNDLKNGQLYRAEIDAIDRTANTADITLLDECSSPASLMDVPFFYHCETSTGTLEDLERGNEAFVVGDWVYVMFAPTVGENEARFYIIGHVDIRGTKRCSKGEYIVIVMGPYWKEWVVIYDTASLAMLDLATFEPLPGSPSPPASFPCERTPSFLSWLSFNFEIATPAANIPHTISVNYEYQSVFPETLIYLDTNHSSQPQSPGYFREQVRGELEAYPDSYTLTTYDADYENLVQSIYSPNYYFLEVSASSEFIEHRESTVEYTIYDAVKDESVFAKSIEHSGIYVSGTSSSTSCDIPTYNYEFTANVISSAKVGLSSTISSFNVDFYEKNFSGSLTETYQYLNGDPSRSYTGEIVELPVIQAAWNNVHCVGKYGYYSVFGIVTQISEIPCGWPPYFNAPGNYASPGIAYITQATEIGVGASVTYWYTDPNPYIINPIASVTMFDELPELDLTQPVSVIDCMAIRSARQSSGIEYACTVLANHIYNEYGIDQVKQQGPSLMEAYTKKQDV